MPHIVNMSNKKRSLSFIDIAQTAEKRHRTSGDSCVEQNCRTPSPRSSAIHFLEDFGNCCSDIAALEESNRTASDSEAAGSVARRRSTLFEISADIASDPSILRILEDIEDSSIMETSMPCTPSRRISVNKCLESLDYIARCYSSNGDKINDCIRGDNNDTYEPLPWQRRYSLDTNLLGGLQGMVQ